MTVQGAAGLGEGHPLQMMPACHQGIQHKAKGPQQPSRVSLNMGVTAFVMQGLTHQNPTSPSCTTVNQHVMNMLSSRMEVTVAQLQQTTSSMTELQGWMTLVRHVTWTRRTRQAMNSNVAQNSGMGQAA